MKMYGKAEAAAERILGAFRSGDLPQALAPLFVHRDDENIPCNKWSWQNRLLVALAGEFDARGFRQWEAVGRMVKKGEKAFHILVPLGRKMEVERNGQTEEVYVTYGFKAAAVFGRSQTDGEPLPDDTERESAWIDTLPLVEVAREWGLSVATYSGSENGPLGKYRQGSGIALGVRNLSTWAHELTHAADDKLVGLSPGQRWDQEIVAELGGAILLVLCGQERDADLGGAWQYIEAYAKREGKDPLKAVQDVLRRTCEAVALILDTAGVQAEGVAV